MVFVIFLGIILLYQAPESEPQDVSLTQLVSEINAGEVKSIEVKGNTLEIVRTDDARQSASKENEASLTETLSNYGVDAGRLSQVAISVSEPSGFAYWFAALAPFLLPFILISLFIWFMFRQASRGNAQALSFGMSRARILDPKEKKKRITFKDVAGSQEAKLELQEVVEFLKQPKRFIDMGAKIPKGVLMLGSPGTGKTLMARAVAGEAEVPFFNISGSEFVEMFVGVGGSRVRDLFKQAKKNAPAIVFIDEIDAVGRHRGAGLGGGHDEREQTLNQILVEMDGFEQGQNVIVLAATNRADVLDPALLRPGRFDRRVNIGLPDRKDREAILKVHFAKKPLAKNVDLDALSAKAAGSSGADLANIANESAIIAARNSHNQITQEDVTEAFERVAIGPERKSKVMTEKDKTVTAYHEAGHALVGHVLPDADPVHKVTIIPRGQTGGVTWSIPKEDRLFTSLIEFKDVLARALGGRIAEEVVFGADRITTGAGSDLPSAASLARDMIVNQGMGSKKLRNQVFHTDEGMMLDRLVHERDYSDETAKSIDDEVESLITEASNRARVIIKANMPSLELLKDRLLEKETVDADEVAEVLKGAKLPSAAALH